jgi:hypothetical protein
METLELMSHSGLHTDLAKVRQAASKEERDRAISEHINSYITEVGNDRELADAFLTWMHDHVHW